MVWYHREHVWWTIFPSYLLRLSNLPIVLQSQILEIRYAGGICGTGLDGSPVLYEFFGLLQMSTLVLCSTESEIRQFMLYRWEKARQMVLVSICSLSHNNNDSNALWFVCGRSKIRWCYSMINISICSVVKKNSFVWNLTSPWFGSDCLWNASIRVVVDKICFYDDCTPSLVYRLCYTHSRGRCVRANLC